MCTSLDHSVYFAFAWLGIDNQWVAFYWVELLRMDVVEVAAVEGEEIGRHGFSH